MVFMEHSEHVKFELMQRIFKRGDIQNASFTPVTNCNISWDLGRFSVIRCGNYKLSKIVLFLAQPAV